MSESSREPPVTQPLRTSLTTDKSNKRERYDYNEQLKQDFDRIFETLILTNLQREFLQSRWLYQILWMEGRAARARDWYYKLRLTTIIGSVIVPILVSLNINTKPFDSVIKGFTVALSGAVAISAAVEEFFHYGERWRHYRRTAESLKAQGWEFFELSGLYIDYKTHDTAFNLFVNQVENIIQRDVEVYATQVMQEKKQEQEKGKHEA